MNTIEEDEFAGDYATGEAGQWRNKGPKANKPATIGDLVGEGEEKDTTNKRVNNPNILGTKNKNNEGFHYDCNVLFINYENLFGIKPLNIISSTIILEIPEYSEFDYLPDSKTNDPKIYFDYKLNTSFHGDISNSKIPNNFYDNKIIRRNKLNDLTFQWNFQIHRIGKSEYTNLNQRRTTIQLSGIHDGEKIWLTS
jgi:hypothetical protein